MVDLARVQSTRRNLDKIFGSRLEVFYAVKANRHLEILKTLLSEGCGFDVASMNEVRICMGIGCPPGKIAFSNPIKSPSEIREAYKLGVRLFSADSEAEIRKLSELAPGSDIYIRLAVSNEGSVWPLTRKFGVERPEAVSLLSQAVHLGLNPVGLTFHVGSQCLNPENWEKAIDACAEVFTAARREGIKLKLLNLGGGLPALEAMTQPPSIEEIGRRVVGRIERHFSRDVRVLIEPGRHMVATSGTLVASVIGEAERRGEHWIYLDAGVYNGLMEIHEKFPYEVRTEHPSREKRSYVMAGPTCDSVDVIFKSIVLPKVELGDRILFMNAGAYTTGYDRYNGFDFPETVIKK